MNGLVLVFDEPGPVGDASDPTAGVVLLPGIVAAGGPAVETPWEADGGCPGGGEECSALRTPTPADGRKCFREGRTRV